VILLEVEQSNADLPHIVEALHATSTRPGCLHGRQQHCDQNANNGDDNQQLHQRKTV
jgi:hypothetical protein